MKGYITDKSGKSYDEFLLAVQMGKVDGAEFVWKFGYSDVNLLNVQNTIYDHNSGLYPYHLGYGVDAKLVDLVSDTPLSDDGREIMVIGLDQDGNEVYEVVLIGATSTTTFSRVYRLRNHNGINVVGEVNLYVTGTTDIVAHIDIASQASLMSMYTIPLGRTGFLNKGTISVGSGKEGVVDWMVRKRDHVFTIAERVAIYQNVLEADRPFIPMTELSDIEVRFTPAQANTRISVNFGILVLDNDKFNLEGIK